MSKIEQTWPAIVIGAGAAGLMAAIFAARGGAPVLVLETRSRPGAKIRMSGGGRCNILPSHVELDAFHTSGSRNSMRNLVQSWPLEAVRVFFERDLGIRLKVEPSGKVFPRSDDASEVIGALLRECARCGVRLRSPFRVTAVQENEGGPLSGFTVEGTTGERLHCRCLVFATGGLSFPKTGSDGAGMGLAQTLGHSLVPSYPALVPLCTKDKRWHALRGLSVRVGLQAERGGRIIEEQEGDLLVTHRGFSGPVILDFSHYVTRPGSDDVCLRVTWGGSDGPAWDELLRPGGKASVGAGLRRHFPDRLASVLLDCAMVGAEQRLSELSREARMRLLDVLQRYVLPVAGSEGYKTAEITGGGIPLPEVAARTLESRIVPGLYFCGEILDVTGRIGGYNFLWAWVTGRKAGLSLAAAHNSARGIISKG